MGDKKSFQGEGRHIHNVESGGQTGPDNDLGDGQHDHPMPDGSRSSSNPYGEGHTHNGTGPPIEPRQNKKDFQADLKKIRNVEIFASGEWNGDAYTDADLDLMVQVFNQTKENIRPFLKLGHNDEQRMLHQDGLPAAGWIDNLKRVGNKLVADFIDLPEKIFTLIENKAFRRVSSEIFWNIEYDGKLYKRMLAGVALLGADTPGVGILGEISIDNTLALYPVTGYDDLKSYNKTKKDFTVKRYILGEEKMSEKTKETELETKVKELEDKLEAKTQETEKLAEEKKEFETKAKKFEAENKEKEITLEVEKLGLPKSAKAFAVALLGEEKKEYTIDKKNFNKAELLSEILKIHDASKVNEKETDVGVKRTSDRSEYEAEIEKYMKEHGVKDYAKAYKAVMRGKDDSPKLTVTEE